MLSGVLFGLLGLPSGTLGLFWGSIWTPLGSFWVILAPRAAQDRKREENLGSLAALGSPRGDQFGLTFGLKTGQNVNKKELQESTLKKIPIQKGPKP